MIIDLRWNGNGWGIPKYSQKTLPQSYVVHQKPHMAWPGGQTRPSTVIFKEQVSRTTTI